MTEAGDGGSGDPFSVLIIEDQLGVRRLLEEALRDEKGVTVHTVENGSQALSQVERHPPSLAFLDLKMPGLSGIDVLTEFKKRSCQFPVILITAYGEMEVIRQAESLGAARCLAKPFDIEEIRTLVRNFRATEIF